MPLYDYTCECGKEFEKRRSISDRQTAECSCGKIAKQQLTAPAGISDGYYNPGRMYVADRRKQNFKGATR
ncbi:zinc ribbon domain-containing protein [Klebsiella aerogenes]|uniref:FmdB family zinc ribbon protein n=1 Tax=Klebsiella aerogenes TaxID=548 RepID=UPI00092EF226|nr:zinc ribbon domain-containing protein [Klebsiella aerogenes]EKT3983759.1 zinc ribbon domain-containing protein [Klebsiella aerogenes]MDT4308407.1 zinc ribbon domain-containing protein [Klebsiella aerogenes]PLC39099.1 zinc ribbon domain-containing protein [Klebsiella aerogenes]WPR92337.1 zinc ribbon domain-containing protein [Klebsiella aerogenes]